jgi:hypothetical protein
LEATTHSLGDLSFICQPSSSSRYLILRNPKPNFGKKLLPFLEYHKGIWMNPGLLFVHILANYNLKSVFGYARSINESIENFFQMICFDLLFFGGDHLIAGQIGNYFERKHKNDLGNFKLTQKGLWGLTFAKPHGQIKAELSQLKNPKLTEISTKLSRWNFRIGLLSTSVLLGAMLTTLNALMTKFRIGSENGLKTN